MPPAYARAEEEFLLFNSEAKHIGRRGDNASVMRVTEPMQGASSIMAKVNAQQQQRRQYDDSNGDITTITMMPV